MLGVLRGRARGRAFGDLHERIIHRCCAERDGVQSRINNDRVGHIVRFNSRVAVVRPLVDGDAVVEGRAARAGERLGTGERLRIL